MESMMEYNDSFKSALLKLIGSELEQNLGNRVTAALANGILHNIASQLPQPEQPAPAASEAE
jgi:hypothetical protein